MCQTSLICPLCGDNNISHYHSDSQRAYQQCEVCQLVFVAQQYQLSTAEEKAVYDLHQNRPDDLGYRRFLDRLATPLLGALSVPSDGLDFGCGPGPTLSLMLEEPGHQVALFDPFYANNPALLNRNYDFITATEVVEHLSRPGFELDRLWRLLKPGGLLGIMTKQVIDRTSFATWHYKNDPTHISFFSQATFSYLAEVWDASLEYMGDDVIILRK
ncbi:MAG: class I SAM-dependent methyltransferase [Porticoccaceae bacterium]|nr:class I SAM-dependent methyltransferase [Porticoccaceae bacterium]